MNAKPRITVDVCTCGSEGHRYIQWLQRRGFDAREGDANTLDDVASGADRDVQRELNALWEEYCNDDSD